MYLPDASLIKLHSETAISKFAPSAAGDWMGELARHQEA
jgi:hypothetical protein